MLTQLTVIEVMRTENKWWAVRELTKVIYGVEYGTQTSKYKTILHFLSKMNKKGEIDKQPYGIFVKYKLRDGV